MRGATGGSQTHTLTAAQLPKLSGSIGFHAASVGTPVYYVSGVFSAGQENSNGYKDGGTQTTGAKSIGEINFSAGSGQAHNNMPPYAVVNYLIRV